VEDGVTTGQHGAFVEEELARRARSGISAAPRPGRDRRWHRSPACETFCFSTRSSRR